MQGERNQNTSKKKKKTLLQQPYSSTWETRGRSLSARTWNHLLWDVNNVSSSPPPPRARPPYSITFMKICIWKLCRNMRLSWRGFGGEVIHFNKSIKWEVSEVRLRFPSTLSFLCILVLSRFVWNKKKSAFIWRGLVGAWIKSRRHAVTLTFSHIWSLGSWNVISVKQRTLISLFSGNTAGALFDCLQPSLFSAVLNVSSRCRNALSMCNLHWLRS